MKVGFMGLGRMGKNMVFNLLDKKHAIVAYNRSPEKIKGVARRGAIAAHSLEEMVEKLPKQKIVWLMIKAGKPVDVTIKKLVPLLNRGDIIIDGGNSFFKDSLRRGRALQKKGIHFLDVGTSGGMEGARRGACMMIGGDKDVFKKVEVLFRDMCVKNGYGYMGKSGAGHFVKMVHNGIEYGMMVSIGEGMQAIKKFIKVFGTNLDEVAKVYAHGSIVESKLVSWMMVGMKRPSFKTIAGSVPKGETEGEMKQLIKMADFPILKQAVRARVKSRKKPSYAGKLIAVMRNEFGGHAVKKR